MKRHWSIKLLALGLALALPALGLAEELGDVTLWELAVQAGEQAAEPEAAVPGPASNEVVPEESDPEPEIPEAVLALEAPESAPEAEAPADGQPEAPTEEAQAEAAEGADGELILSQAQDEPATPPQPEARGEAQPQEGSKAASASGVLTLGATKLTLGKGERRILTATLSEGDTSAIAYASSKKSVVAVNSEGLLYAKKTGSAVITVISASGAKAQCKVKVVKAPSKVTLSATKAVVCMGESAALKAKLPSGSASMITWASSNPAVAAVDESGNIRGVAAGTATVRATAFNGKKADCTVKVLAGSAPTSLSAGVTSLTLGVKETFRITPVLGEGESAVFAYASSDKKIATVSSAGVVTAKKAGACKIAVATHNGLKATVKVKVAKAPTRVTLSRASLSMKVGESAALSAWVPSGTASAFTWSSSDASVATVDAGGNITALKAGQVKIGVRTYNKKTAVCAVTVTENGPSVEDDTGEDTSVDDGTVEDADTTVSIKKMIANLRASSALGTKKEAIASVIELLIRNGFEPAFAAGVGANIYSEGTYGMFESSRYVTNPKARPRYFCYLDGGEYYSSGSLVAVYMSKAEMKTYTGKAEARQRFDVENYYLDNWSKKYVQDIDLSALEAFMDRLADGGWEGKFGLGIVQWTGARTKKLVAFYRKHAGASNAMTAAQVAAAENEMILYDFTGDYKGVYNSWKSSNKSDLQCAEAARSAGSIVCTKYEIPVDKDSKAVTRGNKAKEIYNIMMGGK